MRALIAIGCGALAAACASHKPPENPARLPVDSTTVTMQPASAPDRTASREPGDESRAAASAANSPSKRPEVGRTSELATFADRPPENTEPPAQTQSAETRAPTEQGKSDVDLMVTQQIRKAIVSNPSLSFTALNVDVVTLGGKVTLRGVVKSAAERKTIQDAAQKVAGANNVDNRIDVQR